jgi:hypothetical protein
MSIQEPKQKGAIENTIEIVSFYILIYQTRRNVAQFISSGNCSTCFGWYHGQSSGAQTTVSTASGICHNTVAGICSYRGRVVTGLSDDG